MTFSIIICTCHRAESLRRTLQSLADVDVPPGLSGEVIVVDNASPDHTSDVVRRAVLPRLSLRYLPEGQKGKAYALNAGIAAARGDILLFTDDDVRPPR